MPLVQTNFPPDKDSCSYKVCWNMFKRLANALSMSDADKALIFHDTAARVYRISEDVPQPKASL